TNFVVSALTASAILYTRSAAIAYFSIGAVVCSRTVKLLKRCFRQPRPLHTTPGRQKKSYGMPSTHSAVIAYYAAYTMLACIYLPIHSSLPDSTLTRVIPPLIIVPWSAVIAMSRIWLGHHTWPQVSVGCLYGIIFTPFWFMLWTSYGWNEYGQATEKYFVW
ncbi:hypothetical protein C8Q75DRAFT_723444, partial [Abortiporus biennis]